MISNVPGLSMKSPWRPSSLGLSLFISSGKFVESSFWLLCWCRGILRKKESVKMKQNIPPDCLLKCKVMVIYIRVYQKYFCFLKTFTLKFIPCTYQKFIYCYYSFNIIIVYIKEYQQFFYWLILQGLFHVYIHLKTSHYSFISTEKYSGEHKPVWFLRVGSSHALSIFSKEP